MARQVGDGLKCDAFLGATDLARQAGVSRATINRWVDTGLIEPNQDSPRKFTHETVVVVMQIQRLNKDLRFTLSEIRYDIYPEFSAVDLAGFASLSNDQVRRKLRKAGIEC